MIDYHIVFVGAVGQQISSAAAQTITLMASRLDNLECENPFVVELDSLRRTVWEELQKADSAREELVVHISNLEGDSAKVYCS